MKKQGISTRSIVKAREKALAKSKDQKSIEESFQVVATEDNKNEDMSKQEDMAEGKEDFLTDLGSKLEQLDNNIKMLNTTMDTRMKNINRSIEDKMSGIKKKIEEFDSRIVELNQKMAVFEGSISGFQKSFDEKTNAVTMRLNNVELNIGRFQKLADSAENQARALGIENEELKRNQRESIDKIEKLELMVDDLQGRSRHNTLIFKGFPERIEGDNSSWDKVSTLILDFLHDYLDIDESKIVIERAHRTPMHLSTKQGTRSTDKPRPIYVAFLSWQMSSLVLSNAHKLKDNPLVYGEEQNETQIYIEQMHSPLVTQKRKEMLIKRWKLRQKHLDWKIIMKYPEAKRNVDKEMETEAETP